MAKKKTKKQPRRFSYSSKKMWGVLLVVLALAGLSYLIFFYKPNAAPTTQITTPDGKTVNLSPPTASDKQANDANKKAIVNRDKSQNNGSSSQSASASLVVTDISATSVKAYIQGVFEDGGSCGASATQNSQVITASSSGFKNVSYTQCAPLNWRTPLGPGVWSVRVNYKSASSDISTEKTVSL